MSLPSPPCDEKVFLPPGGEMGELIRSKDWSKTPIGTMEQWPQTLLVNLAKILESPFPQLICWGRELTMLYNDAYIELLGNKPLALGKSLLDAWFEARKALEPLIEKAFAGESVLFESAPFTLPRHGYSEETWFDFSFSPLRDTQGDVAGLIATVIEMTRREREREQRSRAIFEQTVVGMAITTPSGRFLRVNEKYTQITGYSSDELLDLTYKEITHPDDLERDVNKAEQILSGEIQTYTIEKRYISKNGTVVWVNLTCSLVRNYAGEPDYFIAVVEDITERKQAEQRQRESEEKFSRVFEKAPIPTSLSRASDGVLVDVNRAWEAMFGVPRSEALGKTPAQLGISACPEQRPRLYAELEEKGSILNLEVIWYRTKDNSAPVLLANMEAMELGGERYVFTTVQDITERKRTEEAVRESEERFSKSFHSNPAPMAITDIETGRVIDINTKWLQILGYNREEIIGRTTFEVGIWANPDQWPRMIRKLRTNGSFREVPIKFVTKSGEIRHALWSAELIDHGGKMFMLSLVYDITEKKQAEEALRKSEARYRELVQNANSAIIRWKADGTLTFFNEYAQSFFGYSADEVLGKHVGLLVPKEESTGADLSGLARNIVANPERYVNIVNENVRKDGSRSWMAWTNRPIFDEHGNVAEILAIGTDTTERKQAEQALRASEAKYRSLFRNMTEEVHFWEIIRDEKGEISTWRLMDANPPALKTWGKTLQEIKGKTTEEIFGPGATDHYLWVVRKIIADNAPYSFEDYFPHLDKHFRFTSIPMGDHFITTGADITAIKKVHEHLERQVRERTSELELANRAKDEFLANMSHEIRTPMAGVLGLAEILLHQELSANMQDDLEMIRSSAESVMTLISDLFDLSRISQAKLEFHPTKFELRSMLRHAIGPFEFQARSLDLEFTLVLDESLPSWVRIDQDRLGQVIKNLVSNAIKFTEQGFVRIMSRAEKVDESRSRLIFSVSDSGIGIPHDKQNDVFSAFTQLDPSYSKKFAGMGLGLAISKSLVEGMGGEISVQSEEGQGSTFNFSVLCEVVADVAQPAPPNLILSDLHRMKILLAEDNLVNRLFLRRSLVTAGHTVVEVENGVQALEIVERDHFDLILMDIQMPEMDGVEAARRIRSGKHGRSDVPIIALTAYAMKGDREKFLEEGMDGYVTKPVDFGELARVISEVSGQRNQPAG